MRSVKLTGAAALAVVAGCWAYRRLVAGEFAMDLWRFSKDGKRWSAVGNVGRQLHEPVLQAVPRFVFASDPSMELTGASRWI